MCLTVVAGLAAQSIHRVNPAAQGQNNGTSWADAFTDLHAALAAALTGDAIWVAEGTYRTTTGTDRTIHFQLKSGVKLYGGFAGTESSLDEREWLSHPTIFDGDIGVQGDSTDNTFNLLFLPFPDGNTQVDGIIFQNGVANSFTSNNFDPTTAGAAMFIEGTDSIAYPLVKNCRFSHNTSGFGGGAVYATAGASGSIAPRFQNCIFEYNRAAGGNGGAVYRNGSSWLEWPGDFQDCSFVKNSAGSGGAIVFADAQRLDTLQIEGCTFQGNVAVNFGGAFNTGGRPNGTMISVRNTNFEENRARIGGAFCYYSDVAPIKAFSFELCRFEKNRLQSSNPFLSLFAPDLEIYSGYFSANNGEINIDRCQFIEQDTFSGNEITGFFKRMTIQKSVFTGTRVLNCGSPGEILFHNNICGPNVDGFNFSGSQQSISVWVYNNLFFNSNIFIGPVSPSFIMGNVFAGNQFTLNPDPPFFALQPSYVFNNVFYDNVNLNPASPEYRIPLRNDSAYFFYNLIADMPDCVNLPSLYACGTGNIFGADPLFADTASGDYRLQPCSPAVNAGVDDFYEQLGILTDLGGELRILDGATDIGAYESPSLAEAAAVSIRPACSGTATGAVTFDLLNGCAPYNIQWTGANGAGNDTTALLPGDYVFMLTDQRGKIWSQALTIHEAPVPVLMDNTTAASCFNCPNGAIVPVITDGLGPFHYLWSDGSTAGSLSGIAPGDYFLTLTDGAGCNYFYDFHLSFESGTTEGKARFLALQLAPNPAHTELRLTLDRPLGDDASVQVRSAAGQFVKREAWPAGSRTKSLDIAGLVPGAYLVQVRGEPGWVTALFLVN